ncbi:MAG: DNA methyltransferase [Candidatus Kryptoniota bacterium]
MVREEESLLASNSPSAASIDVEVPQRIKRNAFANKVEAKDKPFHEWYRFVLSFPPHLVRKYIQDFSLQDGDVLLDPFCGCGTTLVEGKLAGLKTIGVEAHPFAHFASRVKISWQIDPDDLVGDAHDIAQRTLTQLNHQGISDADFLSETPDEKELWALPEEKQKILLSNSISPLPLHKSLVLLENITQKGKESLREHELLAFAKALVFSISNLHFGPEVGLGSIKSDALVVPSWLEEIRRIAEDLRTVSGHRYLASKVILADARNISNHIPSGSADAIITSPPYPNEKDYTRTTRLESVLLGFIEDKTGLRSLKSTLLRSNTRNVYKNDDNDKWIAEHDEIQRISRAIEQKRIDLNKSSGFERLYGRVTKLYFGGMARHLADLRKVLKPNAKLAYVVGDQASYLRVMIRTGHLLAEISESLGYEVLGLDLFRTRFASSTKEQLREEVLLLKWSNRKVRGNGEN